MYLFPNLCRVDEPRASASTNLVITHHKADVLNLDGPLRISFMCVEHFSSPKLDNMLGHWVATNSYQEYLYNKHSLFN